MCRESVKQVDMITPKHFTVKLDNYFMGILNITESVREEWVTLNNS